jgi:thiol-disulfide isomerase/thioredoxin
MEPVLLRALLVVGGIAVVAVVGSLVRRRDGRLRVVAPAGGSSPTASSGHAGQARAAGTTRGAASARDATTQDAPRLSPGHLDAVGLDLADADAGAVLLGSPTCTPCDAVKRVLAEVADARDGFRWVYADAGDHLELSREFRVLRVPTLLVVAPDGALLARSSGVPTAAELHALLDARDEDGAAA